MVTDPDAPAGFPAVRATGDTQSNDPNTPGFVPTDLPATGAEPTGITPAYRIFNDPNTNTTVIALSAGLVIGDRLQVAIRSRDPVNVCCWYY